MGMRHKNPNGGYEYIDSPVPDCGCNVCKKLADKIQQRGERRNQRSSGGNDRRVRQYRQATSRPHGVQEAGNTWVDGEPGYYEDGGSTGKEGRQERYSGPKGPFGPGHHHDTSNDGGKTWKRWH